MTTELFAATLLAFTIATHVTIWRIRVPARQTRALLVWLLIGGPLTFAAAWLAVEPGLPWSPSSTDLLRIGLFHASMSLAYIVTYSAIEAQSPTLAIMTLVAEAGANGRTRADLDRIIDDEWLFGSRVSAAVRDGLLVAGRDVLVLTPKGRRVARMFAMYRAVLAAEKGR